MNPLPDLAPEETVRYARHTVLPEAGFLCKESSIALGLPRLVITTRSFP
jgi:hypothetical protein